jgi:DNA primase
MQVAKVHSIARAPEGKEVEDLTRREVTKALQTQIPADQALALVKDRRATSTQKKRPVKKDTRTRREPRRPDSFRKPEMAEERRAPSRRRPVSRRVPVTVDEVYVSKIGEIKESFKALLFGDDKKVIVECGVAELAKTLEDQEEVHAIVFDGVITQRLVDIASKKKTQLMVGAAVADIENKPSSMNIATFDDLGQ